MARLERVSQREYAKQLGVSNTAVGKAIDDGKIVKGYDKKTKQILVQHADREWGNLHRKIPSQTVTTDAPGQQKRSVKLDENTDFAEARRINEVLKAQMANLELQKAKGELLEKKKVEAQLFVYGQEVRKAIEIIPERSIDAVRAAGTRNEALLILEDAIAAALTELTNITNNAFEQK
jgi:hypothetical protein